MDKVDNDFNLTNIIIDYKERQREKVLTKMKSRFGELFVYRQGRPFVSKKLLSPVTLGMIGYDGQNDLVPFQQKQNDMFGSLDEVANIGSDNLVPGGENNTFSDGGNEQTKLYRLPPKTEQNQMDVRMENLPTPKTGRGPDAKV